MFEKIKRKTRNKYNSNLENVNIKVKKGMCFWNGSDTTKQRIAVVLKVMDDLVIFTVLTSSNNIHKFLPVNDENFPDSYFSLGLYICHTYDVKKHLITKTINDKSINLVKKELKSFFTINL